MYDPDPLSTLSGSTDLIGVVDGVFVFEKTKRTGEGAFVAFREEFYHHILSFKRSFKLTDEGSDIILGNQQRFGTIYGYGNQFLVASCFA